MPKRTKLSAIRARSDVRTENIMFMRSVKAARDRASLRVERDRLHSLLYETITPGLRERIKARGKTVTQLLGG